MWCLARSEHVGKGAFIALVTKRLSISTIPRKQSLRDIPVRNAPLAPSLGGFASPLVSDILP
jgi:hypothetical protein